MFSWTTHRLPFLSVLFCNHHFCGCFTPNTISMGVFWQLLHIRVFSGTPPRLPFLWVLFCNHPWFGWFFCDYRNRGRKLVMTISFVITEQLRMLRTPSLPPLWVVSAKHCICGCFFDNYHIFGCFMAQPRLPPLWVLFANHPLSGCFLAISANRGQKLLITMSLAIIEKNIISQLWQKTW